MSYLFWCDFHESRCGWRPEHSLRLFESLLPLLQHVCILTSDRGDGRVLHSLTTLAGYFIRLQTRLQQADGNVSPVLSDSTNPTQASDARCLQCGTEAARVRCLHHDCLAASPPSLCLPCDRLLHEASTRKSHIRVGLNLPSAAQPPPLPSQEAGPWLARFTGLLLTCLRDLLDDRKVRERSCYWATNHMRSVPLTFRSSMVCA